MFLQGEALNQMLHLQPNRMFSGFLKEERNMHSFWNLNRKKLRHMVLVILGISLYVGICALLLTIRKHGTEGIWGTFFMSYGLYGIILPLFVLALFCYRAALKAYARMELFTRFPYNELVKIGFVRTLKNEHKRWKFTEEIFAGIFNDYIMKCDIWRFSPSRIIFYARAKTFPFSSLDYYAVENYMDQHHIKTFRGGYLKVYQMENWMFLSREQLKEELLEFTSILRDMGIRPIRISEMLQWSGNRF